MRRTSAPTSTGLRTGGGSHDRRAWEAVKPLNAWRSRASPDYQGPYSSRSATIGSSCVARREGRYVATAAAAIMAVEIEA